MGGNWFLVMGLLNQASDGLHTGMSSSWVPSQCTRVFLYRSYLSTDKPGKADNSYSVPRNAGTSRHPRSGHPDRRAVPRPIQPAHDQALFPNNGIKGLQNHIYETILRRGFAKALYWWSFLEPHEQTFSVGKGQTCMRFPWKSAVASPMCGS